jgi:hypothetical protein
MTTGKYNVYHLHYGILSYPQLFADISEDGLTEAETLLKEDIKSKGKSLEGYVLYGIEGTNKKSDKKEVRFNTLMQPASIIF